jgi:hypothetical protein
MNNNDRPGAGLALLLRGLHRSRFTGTLELHEGDARGDVGFVDGELISAESGGELGMAALKRLYWWRSPSLRLRRDSLPMVRTLHLPSGELLRHLASWASAPDAFEENEQRFFDQIEWLEPDEPSAPRTSWLARIGMVVGLSLFVVWAASPVSPLVDVSGAPTGVSRR